jgi:hypothetical protein
MIDQTQRNAVCHLLLRETRWMPVSVNSELGSKDRCAPGGAVISALRCAVVEGDAVVGWTENSGFMVREIGADGTPAPLELAPAALAFNARYFDSSAAAPGAVGISTLIAERRIHEQKTDNLSAGLREAAFVRAEVQILDKLQGHSVVGVLLFDQQAYTLFGGTRDRSLHAVRG